MGSFKISNDDVKELHKLDFLIESNRGSNGPIKVLIINDFWAIKAEIGYILLRYYSLDGPYMLFQNIEGNCNFEDIFNASSPELQTRLLFHLDIFAKKEGTLYG